MDYTIYRDGVAVGQVTNWPDKHDAKKDKLNMAFAQYLVNWVTHHEPATYQYHEWEAKTAGERCTCNEPGAPAAAVGDHAAWCAARYCPICREARATSAVIRNGNTQYVNGGKSDD